MAMKRVIYFLQDLQAQPPARSCYVLLALFREITTKISQANTADGIPDRVGFGSFLIGCVNIEAFKVDSATLLGGTKTFQ
jgi:hypothetical protein